MLPPQPPPIPNPENEQRHAYAYHSRNHCNNNIYNDGDTNFRLFSGSYCRWHRWVEYGFITAVVTNHIFCTDLDHICLIQVNISKGVVRFSSLVCFSSISFFDLTAEIHGYFDNYYQERVYWLYSILLCLPLNKYVPSINHLDYYVSWRFRNTCKKRVCNSTGYTTCTTYHRHP